MQVQYILSRYERARHQEKQPPGFLSPRGVHSAHRENFMVRTAHHTPGVKEPANQPEPGLS